MKKLITAVALCLIGMVAGLAWSGVDVETVPAKTIARWSVNKSLVAGDTISISVNGSELQGWTVPANKTAELSIFFRAIVK